jgi:hypothetical protein
VKPASHTGRLHISKPSELARLARVPASITDEPSLCRIDPTAAEHIMIETRFSRVASHQS